MTGQAARIIHNTFGLPLDSLLVWETPGRKITPWNETQPYVYRCTTSSFEVICTQIMTHRLLTKLVVMRMAFGDHPIIDIALEEGVWHAISQGLGLRLCIGLRGLCGSWSALCIVLAACPVMGFLSV